MSAAATRATDYYAETLEELPPRQWLSLPKRVRCLSKPSEVEAPRPKKFDDSVASPPFFVRE